MKNRFQEALKLIAEKEDENLKKLLSMPYDKLEELKKYYYTRYKNAVECGYEESAIVNQKHHDLIAEAITIKQGNEEQAWDFLS